MTAENQLQRPGRIGIRVGEALVAGGPPGTAAEPEVAIGEMDGPFGTAFANLLGEGLLKAWEIVSHSSEPLRLNKSSAFPPGRPP